MFINDGFYLAKTFFSSLGAGSVVDTLLSYDFPWYLSVM